MSQQEIGRNSGNQENEEERDDLQKLGKARTC